MDNIDEIAAYKNEQGSFDVIISLTQQDGQPTTVTLTNMHLSMDFQFNGDVRLVLEP